MRKARKKNIVIRARVSNETKERFKAIAKHREQTESAVARDAILDYIIRWEKDPGSRYQK